MSISDDLRGTIKRKIDDAAAAIGPRIKSAEVIDQSSGHFDLMMGASVYTNVPQLRPFSGFTTGSRARQVLVIHGDGKDPIVLGVYDAHNKQEPKNLRRMSWMN